MSSLLLLSFLTGSRTIQTPTRTGWLNCRSTCGCSLCCSVSCAWFMTNAMKTVLEWTRSLQRWDSSVSWIFRNTVGHYWNCCPTYCILMSGRLKSELVCLPQHYRDLVIYHMSVTVYTTGFVCCTRFREGNMQLWSTSGERSIKTDVTSYRFGVPCLKCWTANMWGSFSKLFKDSALFLLTHNKINERCGSGTGDGFTGEINTLTQFSQCENQIKIDLLNIECKYPLHRILYTLHILFKDTCPIVTKYERQ